MQENRYLYAEREKVENFLEAMGLEEEPMGLYFTNEKPKNGFTPIRQTKVTHEKDKNLKAEWISCVLGKIRRARMEKTAAYFDNEHYGCLGGAFFMGFKKPYEDFEPFLLSKGISGQMEGERYVSTPEIGKQFYDSFNPLPASAKYLVVQPISQFKKNDRPELVLFFVTNEVLSGLHGLTVFITGDMNAVQTPFGVGCCSVVSWPRNFLEKGESKAVIGSFDASCRKFVRKDEVSFSIPYDLFLKMLNEWQESVIGTKPWKQVVRKNNKGKSA